MSPLALGAANPSRFSRNASAIAFFLIAGSVLLVWGFIDLRTSQRLVDEGQLTKARIVGRRVEGARSRRRQYVEIEYRAGNGEPVRGSDRVSQGFYERAKVGDTVNVNYLPSRPNVHSLGRTVRLDYANLLLALLCFVLAGVGYLFATFARPDRVSDTEPLAAP